MDILKDRGLISVFDGRIVMHDLIQEMGKEIVRKECPPHPGKRSRLFNAEEIWEVLRKNKGSDAIQCILLHTNKVKEAVVHAQSFEKMDNLRMLMVYMPIFISNVSLESSLVGLPNTLKFLYWNGFPQRSWPLNFCPQNLVTLEMPDCHLEQLWEGDQNLPNLKRLDLSGSGKLTRIPDFSLLPNIEEIILSYCGKLIKVHSSILLSKLRRRGEPRAYRGHIFPTSSEIFSITFDRYNEEEEVANNTIYLEVLTKFMKATFSPWLLKIGKFTPDSGHFGRSSGAHLRRHSHTCTTFILVPFRRASTTEFAQLPSSFCNFVNLRSLELQKYTDIESLPNSIVNLKLLSKLDCSGCPKLTEIPRHIGRLTSLMELSLRDSGIVNLPESIAHLSSLKSLDLSDCKKLECIPPIPPFLEQLEALDCPSISDVKFSCSKLVKFQRGYSGARANIEEDARLRMTDDRYRSVIFCFPGSTVPGWFHFRGKGHSVTINEDLSFCSDDRLTGFALCVAFGVLDIKGGYGSFRYSLKFEYDDGTQIIPYKGVLNSYFKWDDEDRGVYKDHTFVWIFNLESLMASGMSLRLCDARSFTFEISPCYYDLGWPDYESVERELKSGIRIKECGICPLYTKKKDDKYGGAVDYSASENDIEEFSGSNVAHSSGETGEDRKRNAESYPVS
ncbi:hypothetical protein ACSQ67_005279 [Phaseolus vulgaris]